MNSIILRIHQLPCVVHSFQIMVDNYSKFVQNTPSIRLYTTFVHRKHASSVCCLECPRQVGLCCRFTMASVDLHANMYTSMEIYDVYEMDPWYKLRCCVHWYKFLLCQTLARGVGGGGSCLLWCGLVLQILRYIYGSGRW